MNQLTELQALQNAANHVNLTIHEEFTQDKRRKIKKYFACDSNNRSVSGAWDYTRLNHFLLGWIKCKEVAG